MTVVDPRTMTPGLDGMQLGGEHGVVRSPTRSEAIPPMFTVGDPPRIANGVGGCANGVGTGAGG
jgi:hypothetical protein